MATKLSKYTKYIHPCISIAKGIHGNGLICADKISMGSILLIENGIFNIKTTPSNQDIERIINQHRNDPDIRDVLDTMYYTDTAKIEYDTDDIDIQRYIINSVGGDLFPMISKMNHGYPTNVAIFRSNGSDHAQNENQKIVIATDDLIQGQELVFDYFNIVTVTNIDDSLERFEKNRRIHNFKIDQSILDDFVALDGRYNYLNVQTITDGKSYKRMFDRIVNDIYLNGIFPSGHLAEIDELRIDERKRNLKDLIFDIQRLFYDAYVAGSRLNKFDSENIGQYNDMINADNLFRDKDKLLQLLK